MSNCEYSPFKDLAFPLNVYAHALLLEEGEAEYLHYGLFEHPGCSFSAAQRHSSDLVFARLPAAPCRILEVGCGLGTTLGQLSAKGYAVHGITPDASQIRFIQERLSDSAPVSCETLESFAGDGAPFDLMLLQESGQYIDPLVIFNKALDVLSAEGEILLLDEFALKRVGPGSEGLHLLPDFLALAERFGFVLLEERDLSASAAPTLDYILEVTTRHRARLIDDLDITPDCLDALDSSNRLYREKYSSGRFGYRLLHFRRTGPAKFRLRTLEARHFRDFSRLFEHTFGQPISERLWHWKYAEGRGGGIGLWDGNGELVAHYGGTHREIRLFGQPAVAFQACDLMVARAHRGFPSRTSPLFLVTASFLERELGFGKQHLLGIGFPNERAYRVPLRLGLYADSLGAIQRVDWPARKFFPYPLRKVRKVECMDPGTAALIDECWTAMSSGLGAYVAGVRDAAYVAQRYVKHPEKQYQLFAITHRFSERAIGLLVLHVDASGDCELLDVIGALEDVPFLVIQARRVAFLLGCGRLYAWLIDNIIPVFRLPAEASIQDLHVLVPGNGWTAAPPISHTAGRWWLTGGDTDSH